MGTYHELRNNCLTILSWVHKLVIADDHKYWLLFLVNAIFCTLIQIKEHSKLTPYIQPLKHFEFNPLNAQIW